MRLRDGIGYFYGIPLFLRYVRGVVKKQQRGFLRALIYHDIPPHQLNIFEKQIKYLSKYYRFIDMNSFVEMMEGNSPIEGGNILLTFDDGFKSNRIVAENILQELNIKAAFFIASDFIDCKDRYHQKEFIANKIDFGNTKVESIKVYEEPMDWSDLEYLLEKGHTIGSHTRNHRRLSEIVSSIEMEEEIIGSGRILSEKLGITVDCFAYPFGNIDSINKEALIIAKRSYKYVFSGIRGCNYSKVDSMALRRETISLNDSSEYIRFILEGGFSPYYYLRRKKLDHMVP